MRYGRVRVDYNDERLGCVPVLPTLPLIRQALAATSHPLEKHRATLLGRSVVISGLRLRTFAVHGTRCVACGLTGTVMAVERCRTRWGDPDPTQPYQLNLYGQRDGRAVWFIHDHTVARALGGGHDLGNTTPMCERCNARKAQAESDAVRRDRGLPMLLRGQGKRESAHLRDLT